MSDEPTGKPLIQKLGFASGDSIAVETTPDWYSGFADANGLDLVLGPPATHAHLFCSQKSELTDFINDYDLAEVEKSIWLSWPKQSSGLKTEVGEQTLRDIMLPLGWVDTKVASIDSTWSGLKFLRRK